MCDKLRESRPSKRLMDKSQRHDAGGWPLAHGPAQRVGPVLPRGRRREGELPAHRPGAQDGRVLCDLGPRREEVCHRQRRRARQDLVGGDGPADQLLPGPHGRGDRLFCEHLQPLCGIVVKRQDHPRVALHWPEDGAPAVRAHWPHHAGFLPGLLESCPQRAAVVLVRRHLPHLEHHGRKRPRRGPPPGAREVWALQDDGGCAAGGVLEPSPPLGLPPRQPRRRGQAGVRGAIRGRAGGCRRAGERWRQRCPAGAPRAALLLVQQLRLVHRRRRERLQLVPLVLEHLGPGLRQQLCGGAQRLPKPPSARRGPAAHGPPQRHLPRRLQPPEHSAGHGLKGRQRAGVAAD
mmetsp:Transcript_5660/g.13742  ORF Transcript_5660/g.13742 Transcript_5660/m.13742 type:complete len:348 (+) Transcript_5660:453-1496(+)